MPKITLVGAGSVVFAKNLICDVLQFPALANSTICLMDIDPERLAVTEKLTRRIIAQLGVGARVEATLDLRKACTGAKFVITTIQVGGYRPSTIVDFKIPEKYGVRQTIADTLGVGGVFRALRSIPKLVKVARMMQEVGAPDSLLLNYTNPMAMNMWAIDRMSGQPAVGLCHSVQGTSRQIASYCGLDSSEVSYRVAGINHMAFFLKFEYKGKDAYPLLFRALDNPSTVACDRVRFEMMRRLGYFVTESSEHQSEYTPYFIHHGQEVIEKFAVPIDEYLRRCEAIIAIWHKEEKALLDESKPVEIGKSVEYGSTIINSMVSGDPSVIYGNVPNKGLITNLREGCCVEVPCLVDKQGIQPTYIGDLPPQLTAIINSNINVQELTVEAAVTGQREYIYQAVMMDPHTATVLTLDKIWAMCDEMIEAHQADGFLGEFKPVIKNTGKPLSSVQRVYLSIEPKGVPFFGGSTRAAFELVAENSSGKPFCGEVSIKGNGAEVAFSPANVVKVDVGAGATIRIPFEVELLGEILDSLTLVIDSPFRETIDLDFRIPKRTEVTIPADPSGKERVPVRVEWSGNRVADVQLGLTGREMIIEAWVEDTDVQIRPVRFSNGSAVQLAFKDPLTPMTPIEPLVIIPDPAGPEVRRSTRMVKGPLVEGATAAVSVEKGGYALTIKVDLEKIGINAERPFLFEMAFHVNALGSAHGKVYVLWQDSKNLTSDVSRFALLIPESKS